MSERISVGDLVVVVKGFRCGCNGHLGDIFTVTSIYMVSVGAVYECSNCGASGVVKTTFLSSRGHKLGRGISLAVLKRIPPLSEIEREQTESKEPV